MIFEVLHVKRKTIQDFNDEKQEAFQILKKLTATKHDEDLERSKRGRKTPPRQDQECRSPASVDMKSPTNFQEDSVAVNEAEGTSTPAWGL